MRKITLLISALLILCVTVSAHSGKTDANGGHYDRSTGEYHYHHGYPAHQHTDGVCPYDFADITGDSSGGYSGGNQKSEPDSAPVRPAHVDQKKPIGPGGKIALAVIVILFVVYPAVLLVWMVVQGVISSVEKQRNARREKKVTVQVQNENKITFKEIMIGIACLLVFFLCIPASVVAYLLLKNGIIGESASTAIVYISVAVNAVEWIILYLLTKLPR